MQPKLKRKQMWERIKRKLMKPKIKLN